MRNEEPDLETFRCPTCIGLLPDAHVRRCTYCGQALRRRHPRVLGDEHRIGARTLPIDRWMLDRLQTEPRRRRKGTNSAPWHGRFAPSPRSAEPDLVLPPVATPPAPAPRAVPLAPEPVEATFIAAPEAPTPATATDTPAFGAAVIGPLAPEFDEMTPAAITALDLDLFVAPTPAPVEADPAAVPEPEAAVVPPPVAPVVSEPPAPVASPAPLAPPYVAPRPVVAHDELDPAVRALVDELYEQARAELAGIDPGTSTDESEPTAPANGGGWVPAFRPDDSQERD
jgi:hypothetical protein